MNEPTMETLARRLDRVERENRWLRIGSKIIPICLVLFLAQGCAGGWQKTADSWKGHHLDDLVLSWGPPADMHELKDGRKVVSFRHSRMVQATQYYCDVSFNTDATGIIVSSNVEGNIGGCNRFFSTKGPPAKEDEGGGK